MLTSEHTAILGDLATWVTAFGTIGAFIVAFKQIHTERHERKKRETREQLAAEREQARSISAWVDGAAVIVSNSSPHPVHNAVIELTNGEKITRHTIAPGQTTLRLKTPKDDVKITDFTFTDTQNHMRWQKIPGKPLNKLQHDTK